jgi:hypothetical protein
MEPHTETQQEERPLYVGYNSLQMEPHTDTHNRKDGPSLWATLAQSRDHIQTHTTGRTARHCGLHWRIDGTTYRHTTGRSVHCYGIQWDVSELGARVIVVVKALCYKPEGRRFETRWGEWFLSSYLILPYALGPVVYSASNRNEYQKHKNDISGQ